MEAIALTYVPTEGDDLDWTALTDDDADDGVSYWKGDPEGLNPELSMAVDELRDARREAAQAERRAKDARDEVLRLMGDRLTAMTGSGEVTVRVTERTGVDRDRLEAMYPEVFAAVRTSTEVRTVVLPK